MCSHSKPSIKRVLFAKPINMQRKLDEFKRLLEIMDKLREQCPWDRKQTNESLSDI